MSVLSMVFLLRISQALPASAAEPEVSITQSGDTALSATLAKREIQIQFHTYKARNTDPGFPVALSGYREASFIQELTIKVGGQMVWVPRSAYADIFNARSASVRLEKGYVVLLIGGADGSDLYSVRVVFNSAE
ncbi:MAG TPA: hypothetical protein VKT53_09025 [Candidatus Acidoferrum sp.]|nr:hypothetical protein [Candidatus Acidoferrum sp.]